jgi:hypothetical protein
LVMEKNYTLPDPPASVCNTCFNCGSSENVLVI